MGSTPENIPAKVLPFQVSGAERLQKTFPVTKTNSLDKNANQNLENINGDSNIVCEERRNLPRRRDVCDLNIFHQLLLAWTLFLKRGSIGHEEDEITISWAVQSGTSSLQPMSYSFDLSEARLPKPSTISECLGNIRDLGATTIVDCVHRVRLQAAARSQPHFKKSLLTVDVSFSDEALELSMGSHNSETFGLMQGLLITTFTNLLETVRYHQTLPISQTLQVQTHEKSQMWAWNNSLPPLIDQGIHERFVEVAQEQPTGPAVTSHDGDFTYGEVNTFSTKLAYELRDLGVEAGCVVPCCFEKSAWTVIAVLAVMKAGAAFVLTDPSQPQDRLKVIAAEVGAQVVLTSLKYEEFGSLIAPKAKILSVGPPLRDKVPQSLHQPLSAVPGSSLMYMIFTSGSTGKPKGVMISHSSYASGAIPRADIVGYTRHTRVLDFASYAFDVSIDCMLLTLATGGCICVPSDDQRINDLSGMVRQMRVNMVHTTPSIARVFDADVIPRLKVLGLGGEAVPPRDASKWNKLTNVVVAYGPSECTVGCAFNNNLGKDRSYTSLGKGCGGLLWIVDPNDHNKLSPIGAAGELLVEGPVVGDGYVNEPEKTVASFIESPDWLTQGSEEVAGRHGRLYKTGDLVRYDPDGSGAVVFVGRKDQQVKIRGQRVELEEVEHHLRQYLPPKTVLAAEIITPGNRSEPMLVAFVAGYEQRQENNKDGMQNFDSGFRLLLEDTEQHLVKDVPKYMIPAAFISVPQIPTTVSGKTDRKRLRAIGSSLSRQQIANWRTVTNTGSTSGVLSTQEQTMNTLWTRVLGDDAQHSAEDNFFALGGDSLKAMKLVALARLEELSISMTSIFAFPTLAGMASKAEVRKDRKLSKPVAYSLLDTAWDLGEARDQCAGICGFPQSEIEDMYPCTPLQEGLMALSAKNSEAYVAQRVLQLQDSASAERLKQAFDVAAKDCPILRTRIVHIRGRGLVQVVRGGEIVWQKSGDLKLYLKQDRAERMELGTPLCRFALVAGGDTETVNFVLTMHHALYDGWSMPLIVDRVNRAYKGLTTIDRTPFTSFIENLQCMNRATAETYWRTLLQGTAEQRFPTLPYADYQTNADELLERYISAPSSRDTSNTLAAIIRAAWTLVTARHSDSSDVVFGETLTGRNANIPGIEEIEGPLITTVPIRIQLRKTTSLSDFIAQVHQQTIDRIPYEQLGLQHIRTLSRDARMACDLKVGLVLHPSTENDDANAIAEGPAECLVPAGDKEAAQEALKFNSYALMLVCTLEKDGFLTMASFDSQTISVDHTKRLLEDFDEMVQTLLSDGDRQLHEILKLSDEDFDRTIVTVSKSPIGPPSDVSLVKDVTASTNSSNGQMISSNERFLAALWSRVLRIDEHEIGSSDSFFDHGGDSISAMKLVSELRQDQYNLTVAQIFNNRKLSAMAELLEQSKLEKRGNQPISNDAVAKNIEEDNHNLTINIKSALNNNKWRIQDLYRARPLQEIAVDGTTQLPRYSLRYEQFFFRGQINKQQLFQSCQKLLSLNEILRTVFVKAGGHMYAAVLEDLQIPVVVYDVNGDVTTFAKSLCDLDVSMQVQEASSFVKFFFVENEQGESCLIFRLSHAQYDEICLPHVLGQLSALYQGEEVERSLPYSKFVQHLLDDNIPKSAQYWRTHLRGSNLSILRGPDGVRPDRTRWASLTKTISTSGRCRTITIATFPTAAWALTLARRLSISDVVFGEVASGRNTGFPNADTVIGPCWQYIPFRLQFDTSWTYLDLLQAVQDQHITSSQFEGMALSEIINQCTDWPRDTTWFDSVVHQDVSHVESLPFSVADSRLETYYPHLEPLREWKIQAFADENEMVLEVVTYEAWRDLGKELLDDLAKAFELLIEHPDQQVTI